MPLTEPLATSDPDRSRSGRHQPYILAAGNHLPDKPRVGLAESVCSSFSDPKTSPRNKDSTRPKPRRTGHARFTRHRNPINRESQSCHGGKSRFFAPRADESKVRVASVKGKVSVGAIASGPADGVTPARQPASARRSPAWRSPSEGLNPMSRGSGMTRRPIIVTTSGYTDSGAWHKCHSAGRQGWPMP